MTTIGGTAAPARSAFLRRHAGLLGALALSVACVLARDAANAPRLRKVDRHHLFGFDAYVYVAMAEDPTFFTVAPWGYRVLSPLVVHAFSGRDVVRGFRLLSLVGLVAAGPLLFAFLRRQGAATGWALAAVALFFFSPPVDEVFRNFFLAEPVALPLFLVTLLAVQARRARGGAAAALLAAALALGALTKDVFVVFLPGLAASALVIHGWRQGLRRILPGALLALAAHFGLRWHWTFFADPETAAPDASAFVTALGRIFAAADDWWAPLFLVGTPLALVGLLRPAGRSLAGRYGLLLLLCLGLPFAAGIYTGTDFPADHFYTDDVPRLLMYALPLLFALALAALRPAPHSTAAEASDHALPPGDAPKPAWGRAMTALAAGVAVGAVAVPFTVLDPYRREDLRGRTDGPFVLAFCRDSLAFARRLEAGRPVLYEPTARRYKAGHSDPVHMERMRWFLREGFGEQPQYGMEEVSLVDTAAALILPVLEPRELTLGVELAANRETVVQVSVNGRHLGDVPVTPTPERTRFRVPAEAL
ncbi:MAG TPA: hypothetical protein VIZ31_06785, partial [Vicinamibacteria bacterium]